MARVKTARTTRARHKKILKQAKGYFGAKHYRFRNANQAVLKSLSYAYVGRKDKKSNFRKLWIARINAAARMNGTTYSKLIAGLKKANVTHPQLKTTFMLDIISIKKNPQSVLYTGLGVITKGTIIEVNVSELGLVTQGGKVVWGKYAQVTNNPENDGCINTVLLV